MIEISEKKMKFLIKAWEGHIKNETDIRSCVLKEAKCPINKFFMDMKDKL